MPKPRPHAFLTVRSTVEDSLVVQELVLVVPRIQGADLLAGLLHQGLGLLATHRLEVDLVALLGHVKQELANSPFWMRFRL